MQAGDGLQAAVDSTVAALEAAGKPPTVLTAPDHDPGTLVQQVRLLADKLKVDAAKVGVMFGGDAAAASVAEVVCLLQPLQQTAASLCLNLNTIGLATSGAGPSLTEDVQKSVQKICKTCIALTKTLLVLQGGDREVRHAVGQVWDACDALLKQSLDNKQAVCRRLMACARSTADVVREMGELSGTTGSGSTILERGEDEEAASERLGEHQTNAAVCSDDDDDEFNLGPDVDFEGNPLSAEEQRVVVAAQKLAEVAMTVVKAGCKVLLTAPVMFLDAWENITWHSKHLQRGIEDLGAALYGPQEQAEIKELADAVVITLECLIEEMPGEELPADSALRQAKVKLEVAKTELDEALGGHSLVPS